MNIDTIKLNNSCTETKECKTPIALQHKDVFDKDMSVFDDAILQRKKCMLFRRLPNHGLIRRLITNPPHNILQIINSQTDVTPNNKFRIPAFDKVNRNVQSRNNRGKYCSLSQTKTYNQYNHSHAHKSFFQLSHQRRNTQLHLPIKPQNTHSTQKDNQLSEFDKLAKVRTVTLSARPLTSRPTRKERSCNNRAQCTKCIKHISETKPLTIPLTLPITPTAFISHTKPYNIKLSARKKVMDHYGLKPLAEIRGWDIE